MNQKDERQIRESLANNAAMINNLARNMACQEERLKGERLGRERPGKPTKNVLFRDMRSNEAHIGPKEKLSHESTGPVSSDNAEDEERKKQKQRAKKRVESAGRDMLDTGRYTAASLSTEDLNTIIGMYGGTVEDIYELAPGQEWMLERGMKVRTAFFLQIAAKAVIQLDPASFRQQADKVSDKHESLRSAFVYKDVSKHYRVVIRDRHPEIDFMDLSQLTMEEFDKKVWKYMAADRMRGFDLERDPLLRISVYKSAEKDTYALVVSQPHINSDGISLAVLFADLFIGYALDLKEFEEFLGSRSYRAYAEHLQKVDVDGELAFWKEYLKDAEEDQLLPGQVKSALEYDMEEYFVPFRDGDNEALELAQKTLKATRFTILLSLWGIMVSRMKKRNSMVIGAVTAGRDSEVLDSMMQMGGFVNVLPVEIRYEEEEKLQDLVRRVQKEFGEVLSNSHCSPIQIQRILGRRRALYGHILNDHGFAQPKAAKSIDGPSIPGIRLIDGNIYDNLSEDLCVYFATIEGKPGCYYAYNRRAISNVIIELMGETYQSMLSSLRELTPDMRISDLPGPDMNLLNSAIEAGRMTRVRIAGFLKKTPVFQSASDDDLLALADESIIKRLPGDYLIKSPEEIETVSFVMRGQALIYGMGADGWNNLIRVLKRGEILSLNGLFEDENESNMMTTGAQGAAILFVRAEALRRFFEKHPQSLLEIVRAQEKEKQNYMKLWLKAT